MENNKQNIQAQVDTAFQKLNNLDPKAAQQTAAQFNYTLPKADSTNSTLQDTALSFLTSDRAVSSQQTNMKDIVSRAEKLTGATRDAAEAGRTAALTSADNVFGNDMRSMQTQSDNAYTAFAQSSQMGTSTAQYKLLNDTVQKNMNDIRGRMVEAQQTADYNYYTRLQEAELNEIKIRQDATQQQFQNLLGLAGIQQQKDSFLLQQKAQDFSQKQAIGSIALQFGLDVQEGDTLDSIIGRAAPLATEERQLELDQIRTQIAAQKASMARASAAVGAAKAGNGTIDSDILPQDLFEAVRGGSVSLTDAYKTAKTPEQVAAVQKGEEQLYKESISTQFESGSYKTRDNAFDTLSYVNPYVSPKIILEVIDDKMPVKSGGGQSFGSRVGKVIKENPGKAALHGATGVAGYLSDKAVSGISKFVRDIKNA
jgi:hypothetical protein